MTNRRFFIALLPPEEVQNYANEVKQHFADVYHSKAAQKSPPHVTLQPPFEWEMEDLPRLENYLETFAKAQKSVPMTLLGYGAFAPRVIFIDVIKSPELLMLQKDLMAYVEESLGIIHDVSKKRAFSPHLTVAFQDLKRQDFYTAWKEFKQRELYFRFTVSQLTLLIHDGQRWQVERNFPFLMS